ncbi:MAG: hypothetical protein HY537_10035, partial [Deltaproteobacteria bacterium]|nr:hypothetical protein [Deltaproteobacteria bacterium]
MPIRRQKPLDSLLLPIVILLVFAAYYCHRFLGAPALLEGDSLQNIYFRLHEALVKADHNPYQWDYSAFMPFIGQNNPIIKLVSLATPFAMKSASAVAQAFTVNVVVSIILLWLLSCSVFLFMRFQQLSILGSMLGAIVVSYTGFHLVGVREFDHFYLMSFIAVGPTLLCFNQMIESNNKIVWTSAAALIIGLSLLGGTNAPLYYYLPVFLLLPFLKQGRVAAWKSLGWQLGAAALGIGIASQTLFPAVTFLPLTNRSQLSFFDPVPVRLWEIIQSILFRDWALHTPMHYHEMDHFIGLPVLVLFIFGCYSTLTSKEKKFRPIALLMVACLAFSTLVELQPYLPKWVAAPIAFIFEKVSIRFPHRFFMAWLFPVAYF